ncbi:MAG: pyridoxal phosphate-dependent aminotransferase [Bacteroidia bacterium]
MFNSSEINLSVLKQRAYNLRWAAQPEGVIPLTAADPDFPCAPEITDAISKHISDRYFSYGPAQGLPALRESIAAYYSKKRAVQFNPDYILPVDSAAFGIYVAAKAILKPGDEAIIFDPVDFLFRYSIEAVGAKAIPFAIHPESQVPDFDFMESLITPACKMICLCNPLNPSGKVFSKTELIKIGELATKYNLVILSDEIWSDIVFSPAAYTCMSAMSEEISNRTIVVHGFSKSYGLAALRIGMLATSSKKLFDLLFEHSLHQSTVHGVNVLSQIAAIAALDQCTYWLDGFVAHLQKMRDLTVSSLNKMPGITCHTPDACYVAFANIKGTGKSSSEIHQYLLETAKVAIVPGLKQWFGDGAEGYIRLCFSSSEEILNEALSRMNKAMLNL